MAVGDIVNGISGVNTTFEFRPAVGVEVMITYLQGGTAAIELRDATTGARSMECAIADRINYSSLKIFVNNTGYMQLTAQAGIRTAYAGITIK